MEKRDVLDSRYLAMICNLVKLQIRFEYHTFLKISKVLINSETVEKPKVGEFGTCKLLILLHAKLPKSPLLDFFDSLSRKQNLSERNCSVVI